jgi:ribosomal protein S18 acetylase RimI-like enzyme
MDSTLIQQWIGPMAANLAHTMRSFADAEPGSQVAQIPHATLVDVGQHLAAFNSVILREPVDEEAQLHQSIATAKQHFGASGAWSYWVGEGFFDPLLRRQISNIFGRYRLRRASTAPGMVADQLAPPKRVLPPLQVRRVADDATRLSFCHLMSVGFEGSAHQLTSMYSRPHFWHGAFRGFVGTIDGRDVTAGATVVAGGVLGIYAVATLPDAMRRGYAEALMRQAVDDVFADCGAMPLVLQSSVMALPLYRRMGFESITNFSLYCTG